MLNRYKKLLASNADTHISTVTCEYLELVVEEVYPNVPFSSLFHMNHGENLVCWFISPIPFVSLGDYRPWAPYGNHYLSTSMLECNKVFFLLAQLLCIAEFILLDDEFTKQRLAKQSTGAYHCAGVVFQLPFSSILMGSTCAGDERWEEFIPKIWVLNQKSWENHQIIPF